MAGPGVSAAFADLPTEMKATVFAYVRQKRYRKTVCLVSREWRDIMGPILWENLLLRPAANLPGELACLLSPNNRVLAHVRFILIQTDLRGGVELEPGSEFGVAFKLILGALTRNCLIGIKFGMRTDLSTLLSILQSQQTLQALYLRTNVSTGSLSIGKSLATHGSWVTPTLHNIQTLRITLLESDENRYEHSAFLLKNTPRLRSLCLGNESGVMPFLHDPLSNHDAFGGPYTNGEVFKTPELIELQLRGLDLRTYPASIFAYIDFSRLHALSISQCTKVGTFLTALVAAVPHAAVLSKLELSVHRKHAPMDVDIQAIEAVVKSASSLQKLWLDVGLGRAISASCLARHGTSLRHLALAASSQSGPPPYYSSSELGKLLNQVPNLEDLSINLPPISLGHVRFLAAKFKLPAQDEADPDFDEFQFSKSLECIAKHRSLRTLRIFTTPLIDCETVPNPNFSERIGLPEEYVYTSQAMMQKFATEVCCYFAKHGSKINTIVLSPDFTRGVKRPSRDENGHMWPRYFYRCGWTRSTNGEDYVVAVPAETVDLQYFDRPIW